jgi:hypothetical protein
MFKLFVLSLVVYKITAMLIDYDGPFDIFLHLREFVEKYQPPRYRLFNFDCHFCLGTWVSLPFALIFYCNEWFVYWFAISALAWFMHVIEERVSR